VSVMQKGKSATWAKGNLKGCNCFALLSNKNKAGAVQICQRDWSDPQRVGATLSAICGMLLKQVLYLHGSNQKAASGEATVGVLWVISRMCSWLLL